VLPVLVETGKAFGLSVLITAVAFGAAHPG